MRQLLQPPMSPFSPLFYRLYVNILEAKPFLHFEVLRRIRSVWFGIEPVAVPVEYFVERKDATAYGKTHQLDRLCRF